VQRSAETDSAATPSDANRAKPMVLKKCEIFSSLMSPRAATRQGRLSPALPKTLSNQTAPVN
jgi:hypothetical protein